MWGTSMTQSVPNRNNEIDWECHGNIYFEVIHTEFDYGNMSQHSEQKKWQKYEYCKFHMNYFFHLAYIIVETW